MRDPIARARRGAAAVLAVTALASFAFLAACRSAPIEDVPGEFTFRGLPVHPAAVSALYRSGTGTLDLAAFQTRLPTLQWEAQPGWWVTEFETDPASGRVPFFAYAAFAAPLTGGAELYILAITFNTGEPSDHDNILLLQRSGDWLGLVRAWTEGSACNGGVLSPRLEGDEFFYSRELTPGGLLELAIVDPPLDLVPHEDLEASDTSCFAAANYVYSLTQDREDLVSIRLYDEPAVDERGRTEGFRYQSCFNRVYNAYLAEGRTALTPKELDEFAARFREECLKPRSAEPASGDAVRK
jgi:hypothetical protein